MADIELVIKIPEEKLNIIKNKMYCGIYDPDLYNAIANGIPLPKGHGKLKDFEKIYADMKEKEELARQRVIDTPTNSPCYTRYIAQLNERTGFVEMLFDIPTIIEADKAESEDKE